MNTVFELVNAQAKRFGARSYFIDASAPLPEQAEHLSFEQLRKACMAMRGLLRAHGVMPGDTVAVVMPNGWASLVCLLGCMYSGVRVNPVNLLSQPEVLAYVIEHSDCKLVLADAHWAAQCIAALPESTLSAIKVLSFTRAILEEYVGNSDQQAELPLPGTQALLMYTSGTTGKPKGVMHTHATVLANAHTISQEHQLTPDDRVTAVLPLYHINAFAVTMLSPLWHGGSLVMPPKFSALGFWPMVIQYECTWLNVVPTIISYLLEGDTPNLSELGRVRFCRSASAALPPEHHRAFEAKFGIGIVETMGLTETVAPAFSNPLAPDLRKIGSVGQASGCEARVVNDQAQTVPDGQTGEVLIRGPQVMLGYYKNAEATQASFYPDAWLRTGDLGHRDPSGFFFITGRIKELIIKGGENIAPREIDEAVLRHEAVLDAACVGVPDKHYGQEILLAVMLKPGAVLEEAALRDYCLTVLGRYKSPRYIHFVEDLPRGPSGKVQRLKLAQLLA